MSILRKEVDKSLLKEGISIPKDKQQEFLKEIGLNLGFGETESIEIFIDEASYDAVLKNQKYDREKYPNHSPIIQIRYSSKGDLVAVLRKIFSATDYYINNLPKKDEEKSHTLIPDDLKEYVEIETMHKTGCIRFICEKINEEKEERFVNSLDDDRLQRIAVEHSKTNKKHTLNVVVEQHNRDKYISEYAKRVANGICQLCNKEAPFNKKNGEPYLESHHIEWLSKGGDDTIDNVVALCPNCHRKMHVLNEKEDVEKLKKIK